MWCVLWNLISYMHASIVVHFSPFKFFLSLLWIKSHLCLKYCRDIIPQVRACQESSVICIPLVHTYHILSLMPHTYIYHIPSTLEPISASENNFRFQLNWFVDILQFCNLQPFGAIRPPKGGAFVSVILLSQRAIHYQAIRSYQQSMALFHKQRHLMLQTVKCKYKYKYMQ